MKLLSLGNGFSDEEHVPSLSNTAVYWAWRSEMWMYDDGRWTSGVEPSAATVCGSLDASTKGIKCSFDPTMGKDIILKT